MCPLDTLSVLEFTGHDAGQFLHNQLSADIGALSVGDAGFACYCNPAGRVLGLLLVSARADCVLAVCSRELAGQLIARLSMYILRADVGINLRTDLALTALAGDADVENDMVLHTTVGLDYGISPAVTDTVRHDGQQALRWKETELKAGVVWLDSQSSAQFLPQMLGFESIGALSFKKGCFPGQEIIARTRYLGSLKRRPLLLQIDSADPVPVMEKVSLQAGDERHGGVVVDRVSTMDGMQTLFIVVRAPADIRPQRISIGEQAYAVL